MSSLVRINTEDSNAIFNETLSEDFIIEENSSIALQSAAFTRNSSQLELNANNTKITFRSNVDNMTNDRLDNVLIKDLTGSTPQGVINASNFPNFLRNIAASINRKLICFGARGVSDSGCEMRVYNNEKRKVSFEMRKSSPLVWTSTNVDVGHTIDFQPEIDDVPNVSVAVRDGVRTLAKDGSDDEGKRDGITNIDRAFAYSRVPSGLGAKYCSVKVERFISNQGSQAEYTTPPNAANPLGIVDPAYDDQQQGQSGFVIGMVDNEGYTKLQKARFNLADLYAYCGIDNNAGRYFFGYGQNTEFTDAEAAAPLTTRKYCLRADGTFVANDRLGIAISGGKINFFHQRDNGGLTLELNSNNKRETRHIDPNRQYYWVIAFIGNQGHTRLSNVEAMNDAFFVEPTGLLTTDFISSHDQTSLGALPAHDTSPITPVIRFQYRLPSGVLVDNTELSKFLGFTGTLPLLPFTENPANTFLFSATGTSHQQLGFESYIIILNNVPLNSYDTEVSGKKNILYTIVNKIENNNGVPNDTHIAFNSQYPIFMKVDNKNRLSLRQIQARIVNEHHELIDTIGISSLTMLIRKD